MDGNAPTETKVSRGEQIWICRNLQTEYFWNVDTYWVDLGLTSNMQYCESLLQNQQLLRLVLASPWIAIFQYWHCLVSRSVHSRHVTKVRSCVSIVVYFLILYNLMHLYMCTFGSTECTGLWDVDWMSCGWEESHPETPSWVCCVRAKSQGHERIRSWLSAAWAPSPWMGGMIPVNI